MSGEAPLALRHLLDGHVNIRPGRFEGRLAERIGQLLDERRLLLLGKEVLDHLDADYRHCPGLLHLLLKLEWFPVGWNSPLVAPGCVPGTANRRDEPGKWRMKKQ